MGLTHAVSKVIKQMSFLTTDISSYEIFLNNLPVMISLIVCLSVTGYLLYNFYMYVQI